MKMNGQRMRWSAGAVIVAAGVVLVVEVLRRRGEMPADGIRSAESGAVVEAVAEGWNERSDTLERALEEAQARIVELEAEVARLEAIRDPSAVVEDASLPPQVVQPAGFTARAQPGPDRSGFVPKVRDRVVRALLSNDRDRRWETMRELGIELSNADFERLLADRGKDWRARQDMREALLRWAQSDPEAAARWVEDLEEQADRQLAFNTLIGEWAKVDSDAAGEWLQSLPAGRERDSTATLYIRQLARRDAEDAIAWLGFVEDETLRDSVIPSVTREWAQKDVLAACDWVLSLPPGQTRDRAAHQLVSTIAREEPEAATMWLHVIENEHTRLSMIPQIAMYWVRKDPDGAAAWLQTLDPGRYRDAAVQRFAMHLAASDPESAAAWSVAIEDDNIRNAALINVATTWLKTDAPAAERWLQTAPMSDDQKDAARARAGRVSRRETQTITRGSGNVTIHVSTDSGSSVHVIEE